MPLNKIRTLLVLTGLAFVALGLYRREHLIVLRKAVNICLECIGLG
ncbi:MAG: CD1871A family CXXC motif-containing protein [Acidaminococcaceae bacterium]